MGEEGGQLMSTITGTPLDATRRAIQAGGNAFEKLLSGKENRSSSLVIDEEPGFGWSRRRLRL